LAPRAPKAACDRKRTTIGLIMFFRQIKSVLLCLVLLGLVLLSAAAAQAKPKQAAPKKSHASVTALSASDKQHLLHDPFVIVTTVQAIPKSVLRHLLGHGPEDGIADAGQPFQETDVISGPVRLPFRRLILAAISKEYCLVYYEAGGFAYHTEVNLFRFMAVHADLVWKASVKSDRRLSLPQLQTEISGGRFSEEPRGDQ
jgi:hypothetical protein